MKAARWICILTLCPGLYGDPVESAEVYAFNIQLDTPRSGLNRDWIVRAYFESSMAHGSFRVPDGLDLDTDDLFSVNSTEPFATDSNGEIAGWYFGDSSGLAWHGPFVKDSHVRFALIGRFASDYTQILAITDDGEVFGAYFSGDLYGSRAEIIATPEQDYVQIAMPEPQSIILLACAGGIGLLPAASGRTRRGARPNGVYYLADG